MYPKRFFLQNYGQIVVLILFCDFELFLRSFRKLKFYVRQKQKRKQQCCKIKAQVTWPCCPSHLAMLSKSLGHAAQVTWVPKWPCCPSDMGTQVPKLPK